MANLLRLFKPFDTVPLPEYPRIDLKDIPPASVLLFYGGNKLTELFGNRVYHHPFNPPAFHAGLTVGDGDFLSVGAFKTRESIGKEMHIERRIDVIVYSLSDMERSKVKYAANRDVDHPRIARLPTYGWTDYLRFGIKWTKPSKKDFCSENCVELLDTVGFHPSFQEAYNTAPWTLLEWALANPERARVTTLWVGANFSLRFRGV